MGFLIAAWAGIKRGLKMIGKPDEPQVRAQVAAGMVLSTTALNEWSASNRDVIEKLADVCEQIVAQRRELADHTHQIVLNRRALEAAGEALDRVVSSLDHNSRTIERKT